MLYWRNWRNGASGASGAIMLIFIQQRVWTID